MTNLQHFYQLKLDFHDLVYIEHEYFRGDPLTTLVEVSSLVLGSSQSMITLTLSVLIFSILICNRC